MKKILMLIILALPMAAMAQWSSEGVAYTRKFQNKKAKNPNPMVTVGFYHTGDFYKNAAGLGGGFILNIGRYQDLLNYSVGVEFIEYLGADPRPEDTRNGLGLASGGGQVVVPAILKLQLFPTSKETKFYVGCGGELGFKVHDGGVLKHYYPNEKMMRSHTLAVMPVVGWKSRAIDFGVFYKHYLDKPFYNSIDGKKNFGEDKARFGYFLTCFF